MLATRAAIELDNLRRGVQTDRGAIRELGELLKNSFDQSAGGDNGQTRGSLLDSGTIVILGRALGSSQGSALTKVSQMQELATKVASQFEQIISNDKNQPIETLRDFCVALAREAAGYHKSLREIRTPHPFRK